MRTGTLHPNPLPYRGALALLLLLGGCGELSEHDGPVCDQLGDPGCPCTASGECRDDGAQRYTCQGGLCVEAACPTGTEGCGCGTEGTCADGLVCAADICVSGCAPGDPGCVCRACANPDGCCDADAVGNPMVCLDDVCQPPRCALGTLDCFCDAAGRCEADAVCDDGLCVEDTGQTLDPPADPRCWTPCRGGEIVNNAGQTVACDAEGLLEGCIGDTMCIDGSCVDPVAATEELMAGEPVSPCQGDAECPKTQSCIDGGCYSDCEVDTDCNGSRVCHLRACRLPCTTPTGDGDECSPGYRCESGDGVTGVCLPRAPEPEGEPEDIVPTPVGIPDDAEPVQPQRLVFTSRQTTGRFTLTNVTDRRLPFTLRKTEHTIIRDTGREPVAENPLAWLEIATESEGFDARDEVTVVLDAGESTVFRFAEPESPDFPQWTGILTISAPGMTDLLVSLGYLDSPAGQWSGTAYYLANFGTGQLQPWANAIAHGDEAGARSAISRVGNALVRRWWAFRNGSLGRDEFNAVITSITDESWKWPVSRAFCDNDNAACYPSDNLVGFSVLSDDIEASPVPSGLTQLDVTFNLAPMPDDPTQWVGRIDSGTTLQYPGDPGVAVAFATDPSDCHFAGEQDACVTALRALDAEVVVGGRYPTTSADPSCADAADSRFQRVEIPWLVPGFDRGAALSSDGSGARSRFECRDGHLPLGGAEALRDLNLSLTAANPVPNGETLRGRLEMLDGGLINGEELFVLFRETLPPLLPGQGPTRAYGFLILTRTETNLEPADFEGFEPPPDPERPVLDAPTCADWLVSTVIDDGGAESAIEALADGELNQGFVRRLAQGALEGAVREFEPPTIDDEDAEVVHYVCHDTGFIDESPGWRGYDCPPGSKVSFFTVRRVEDETGALVDPPEFDQTCNEEEGVCRPGEPCAADQQEVLCFGTYCVQPGGCRTDGQPCPSKGTCREQLEIWTSEWETLDDDARAAHWFRPDPEWRCQDPDAVNCDRNRADLREGKVFFEVVEQTPVFAPLDQAIDAAFRYKTRFKSRLSGTAVGFAPQVCQGDSVPYCYDPPLIEEISDRVGCIAHLYTAYYDVIDAGAVGAAQLRPKLERFLLKNYAFEQIFEPGRATPTIYEGFETLNAELLIMLGDEALTNAYASRFDLAGQRIAAFRGSLFEPDGLDLSGPAGFEMFSLYQAVQSYQMALDRLYAQAGTLAASLDPDFPGVSFVSAASAVSWFSKLIRASSQKARAWARIADRYHGFERVIPAQRVIEKAYVTAYLESIFFSQLMRQVLERVGGTERAQVEQQIELAQLTYKDALLTMQNVRDGLRDDVNVFGFTDTYIPFVALDPGELSAFEKVMERAREKLDAAAEKEDIALADKREFDTDAALFQAELTQIELDATSQLAEICGYFEVDGPDGIAVYPATAEYAYLDDDDRTRLLVDPCGLMGNGELAEALTELEQSGLAIDQWKQRRAHLLQTAVDEQERIGDQCQRIGNFANWRAGKGAEAIVWSATIASLEATNSILDRIKEQVEFTAEKLGCLAIAGVAVGTDCPQKGAASAVYTAATVGVIVLQSGFDALIAAANIALSVIEQDIAVREIREECSAAVIDGRYVVRDLMRQVVELDLEGLQLAYDIRLKANRIKTLRNQALCIQATLEEQTRLTIDVEAARNDPNVRLYRNDAILNADRTFRGALREAWRATRMYEYYTNTSYEFRDRLPLVRMVANGDFPLDAYLDDLEEAYFVWEESYGSPDLRVEIISAVDDIFQISRVDRGVQRTPKEMAALFAERLARAPRDRRGAHVLDFRTSLDRLSPLTQNHKVRFIEVELIGDELGDQLGRAYVRQRGDGVGFLLSPDGRRRAYTMPQRTAVVDTFFNGERPLSDILGLFEGSTIDIYRNERMRDRPLHHSGWQLVLNMEDEWVNQDIQAGRIEDVRIYLWYTDFTEL
ncbi:MAG: variable surface family protein [Planctomycetota bacterium]|jgi:hypothetical protein